ncbi:MAG: type I-C CRISPR-associated protein Cas5 [Nitrospinae bacterium]|nr:type I-C CRISPR-associated protein Cas5 [Nitrospinota bacterium]
MITESDPRCNFRLKVWGELACFTRPEMKVERVSYDIITPSAARGILEAIYWHNEIKWIVTQIDILRPVRWMSVRRNEVGAVASGHNPIFIEDERQQRAGLILRDVAYVIHSHFQLKAGGASVEKYSNIFKRRAEKGQCYHRPYLGCREFSANFELLGVGEETPEKIGETRDLGWMLNDLDYSDADNPTPRFFRSEMKNGSVMVPSMGDSLA